MKRLVAACLTIAGGFAAALAAAPSRTPAPATPATRGVAGAPGSRTDFSGIWALDGKVSSGGSPSMEGAVLEVTQKGERIWIQPLAPRHGGLMAEEIVVDGRDYEKSLGGMGKGSLSAKWGLDAQSLWLELTVENAGDPRSAVQRSVWRLSEDRSTWVRETVTVQQGTARQSRLVFRRQDPKKMTTPGAPKTPTPVAKPGAGRR